MDFDKSRNPLSVFYDPKYKQTKSFQKQEFTPKLLSDT